MAEIISHWHAVGKILRYMSEDEILRMCAKFNDIELLKFVLDNNKYIDKSKTLKFACEYMGIYMDMIIYLLDIGAQVTKEVLQTCVQKCKVEVIEYLVEKRGIIIKDLYEMKGDYFCDHSWLSKFLLDQG